jgi:hypothetical protein
VGLHTNVPTCKILSDWPDDLVAHNVPDDTQMFCCERMLVHERIHRREYISRCRRCQRAKQGGLSNKFVIENDMNALRNILRDCRRVRVQSLRAYLPSRERQEQCQPTSSTRYAGSDLQFCMTPVMHIKAAKLFWKARVFTDHSSSSVHTRAPALMTSAGS